MFEVAKSHYFLLMLVRMSFAFNRYVNCFNGSNSDQFKSLVQIVQIMEHTVSHRKTLVIVVFRSLPGKMEFLRFRKVRFVPKYSMKENPQVFGEFILIILCSLILFPAPVLANSWFQHLLFCIKKVSSVQSQEFLQPGNISQIHNEGNNSL